MNETSYIIYKMARSIIDQFEKDCHETESLKYLKSGVKCLNESGKGYLERYESEKTNGELI